MSPTQQGTSIWLPWLLRARNDSPAQAGFCPGYASPASCASGLAAMWDPAGSPSRASSPMAVSTGLRSSCTWGGRVLLTWKRAVSVRWVKGCGW